jgi:hypothetical protein
VSTIQYYYTLPLSMAEPKIKLHLRILSDSELTAVLNLLVVLEGVIFKLVSRGLAISKRMAWRFDSWQ